MQWYKSHSSLRKNPIYKRLSPLSRQAFRNAMDAVAEYEQGDKLALRVGPLTTQELADDLLVSTKDLQKVLSELCAAGFFTLGDDGVYSIAKFTEKTESHADRQRRYRENKKKRDAKGDCHGDVTSDASPSDVTGGNVTGDGYRSREKKEDKDTNVSAIPSRNPSGRGGPSLADLAAYRILDAAWPVVSAGRKLVVSRDRWRSTNKAAAADLVTAGVSAEDVVAMLTVAYEHPEARKFYGDIVQLAKLSEHWHKLERYAAGGESEDEIRRRVMHGDFLPE